MKLSGNLEGLTRVETRELERLFKRRISSEEIISLDLARELIEQSNALERIVALLIDRLGHIREVIIGRKNIVYLPDLGRYRVGTGRLRGLRLIVPDLSKQREGESGATISDDLYTDLEKLRLDMVVTVRAAGNRTAVTYAHILPRGSASDTSARPVRTEKVKDLGLLDVHAAEFIAGLEQEIIAAHTLKRIGNRPRAVLVGVYNKGFQGATSSLAELRELANSAGVEVVDQIAQRRIPDPKTFLGKGKLEELNLHCLRLDAEMLVFDTELKPSQWRAVTNASELKVVDRSMLILDIFAQRATSSDGKLQVELAQLKYNLPKLVEKDAGLSRLSGGIGGRGPGETKLEVGRRVIRDRIAELERRVQKLSRERTLRRQKRSETGFPVVAILGYTNVGKSTLFNALTNSAVLAENKLFATLDPAHRRLRFPHPENPQIDRNHPVILTDTVGFIRDLPDDLVSAFKATLEVLHEAAIFVHVLDASDPEIHQRLESVEKIVAELGIEKVPTLLALNKADLVTAELLDGLEEGFRTDGKYAATIRTSALKSEGLDQLLSEIERVLF